MFASRRNRRLLVATLTSCALLAPTTAAAGPSEVGSSTKGEAAAKYLTATESNGVTRTASTKPLGQKQLKKIAANGELSLKRQLPSAKWRACAWNAKKPK